MLLELQLSPYNSLMAALKIRPYSPRVPRRSLDVKVLGVIASIFHIVQCEAFRYGSDSFIYHLLSEELLLH